MLAYMSIVANEQDDLRLRRIINEPARKIGATTVQNVADIAAGLGVSMLEVVEHAPDYPALARASAALGGFWRIYRRLKEAYDTLPLDVFVSEILEITCLLYTSCTPADSLSAQVLPLAARFVLPAPLYAQFEDRAPAVTA